MVPSSDQLTVWFAQARHRLSEGTSGDVAFETARLAYMAGADAELKACCEFIWDIDSGYGSMLLTARRPMPLKQQALVALHAIAVGANDMREQVQDLEIIRQALELLDD
jgi:hypothetical protein